MLRSTQSRLYFLAFNPHAKSRPNFGLRSVGYYTSETYHRRGHNIWGLLILPVPLVTLFILNWNGMFALLDEVAGGGPRHLTYAEMGQFNQHAAEKPWAFVFPIGEGFAAGPPRYRPAPGATPLHH